jgi:enoyl-CoA hydratase/carnithine racemase
MHPTIANELLLVGDLISADRAYQALLINQVVPRQELMPAATALAERLCENGPLAMRAMKEVLIRSRDLDYAGKMALSEHVFHPVLTSRDMAEALDAFLEKRKPVWKGE